MAGDVFGKIFRLVARIPRGRVCAYGDIAWKVGTTPRHVGWALSGCPDGVPWHRVVNHKGQLSIGKRAHYLRELQRGLLVKEGVRFSNSDNISDFDRYRWRPRIPRRASRTSKKPL